VTKTWRYSGLLRELGRLFRLFMNLNRSCKSGMGGRESFKFRGLLKDALSAHNFICSIPEISLVCEITSGFSYKRPVTGSAVQSTQFPDTSNFAGTIFCNGTDYAELLKLTVENVPNFVDNSVGHFVQRQKICNEIY
jgi:hypothetical protein